MTIQDQAKKVERALRKNPQTAAELADRTGQPHARALNHCMAHLKAAGKVLVVPGRPTKYAKPARLA